MKKFAIACLVLGLFLLPATPALAQKRTGMITGKITDSEKLALPGAFIYISSPSLLGIQTYITNDTGFYRFPELPPGIYKITVEMPGFKTLNIDEISVQLGKTLAINIILEPTTVEEEVTSRKTSPMLDSVSSKVASRVDKDLLLHIPMARDLGDIINITPGAVSESLIEKKFFAIHGSGARSNQTLLDTINFNDPLAQTPITNVNFDLIEQVEVETAAHPADVGPLDGSAINIITKSGGNAFNGALSVFHTSKSLGKSLWTETELTEMPLASRTEIPNLWDFSLSFGGPFVEDRVWYFGDIRFNSYSRPSLFQSWVDPLKKAHAEYDWNKRELFGFFKLTSQILANFRFNLAVNFVDHNQQAFESSLGLFTPLESTYHLDKEINFSGLGTGSYTLDQNTFVDFRAGYVTLSSPLLLNENSTADPQYYDIGTGYSWGSAPLNQKNVRKRFLGSATITRYQDGLLGGTHELKAGGDYEDISDEQSTWKQDNLWLNYFNGSPYLYGLIVSPKTGHTVGEGKIAFYTASKDEGGLLLKSQNSRLSAFVQDSATFARRLTLHLGLRFDHSVSSVLPVTKTASGTPISSTISSISVKVGEDLVKSVAGVNPYNALTVPDWNNAITWNFFSPRFGLSIDVLGNGKTVLKSSFSRYAEYLNLRYPSLFSPFAAVRYHQFYWYDENMDGKVDINDTYALFPEDYRIYNETFLKKRVDPGLKPPSTAEFTVGLEQEIFKDFSLSLRYISKNEKDLIDNVLYAPDLDKDWYGRDSSPAGWWVPFTTTVPASDNYPDTPVTVYFRSNAAPLSFERMKNVPELKRKYQGLEFVFNKRMSKNWQLYGSVVLSKATGNIGLDSLSNFIFSQPALTPNYFVNLTQDSRLNLDRPLAVKLMGTYRFPLGFFFSFNFTHLNGTPWTRTITVAPPAGWAQANNVLVDFVTVNLEEPASRRYGAYENLDLRIEKEFNLGKGRRLRGYLDVTNVLGNKYSILDENDGGFWFPETEGNSQGVRILSPSYKKFLPMLGARTFKLCLSLNF